MCNGKMESTIRGGGWYPEAEFLDVVGTNVLKGPKHEIFVAGIFAQIRPIWLGYLVTRPKNPKHLRLGLYITLYFLRVLF
jgi:hypothetical protein